MNLSSLIGEITEYDKKQAVEIKKPKSWCKSISAFANGQVGSFQAKRIAAQSGL